MFLQRLFFVLFLGVILTFNYSFAYANKIKYSMAPRCSGINVICDPNEKAVCLDLHPSVHIYLDGHEQNESYYPSCENSSEPRCVTKNGEPTPNVTVDCVEFIKCEADEKNIQVAKCSTGKTAKCIGNGNELNGCNCSDGSNAICDYFWEISNASSFID